MAERKERVWDNYAHIGTVRKSERTRIHIGVACRDGVRYICLREFWFCLDEWRPGKDGMTIPLRVPVNRGQEILEPFPNIVALLLEAVKTLEDMPLEDENNQIWRVRRYKNEKDKGNGYRPGNKYIAGS